MESKAFYIPEIILLVEWGASRNIYVYIPHYFDYKFSMHRHTLYFARVLALCFSFVSVSRYKIHIWNRHKCIRRIKLFLYRYINIYILCSLMSILFPEINNTFAFIFHRSVTKQGWEIKIKQHTGLQLECILKAKNLLKVYIRYILCG